MALHRTTNPQTPTHKVPKPPLRGNEDRIFLLDFFGARGPTRNGIKVPASRILTAFPTSPWNTFLGYAISTTQLPPKATVKKRQGVIWGKVVDTWTLPVCLKIYDTLVVLSDLTALRRTGTHAQECGR